MQIVKKALRRVIMWAMDRDQPYQPSSINQAMREMVADINRWRAENDGERRL